MKKLLFLFLAVTGVQAFAHEEPSKKERSEGLQIREVIEEKVPESGGGHAGGCCGIPSHPCAPETQLGALVVDHSMVEKVSVLREPGPKFPEVITFVRIDLTPAGKEALAAGTGKNHGKRLAILVDGTVIATPVINQTITAGYLTWSGKDAKETHEVAEKLKKASLLVKN